jgi:hypothetical protein
MKRWLLCISLISAAFCVSAAEGLDYHTYYASRDDAVFQTPIRQEKNEYSLDTEPNRTYVIYETDIERTQVRVTVSEDDFDIWIGGEKRRFSFSHATMLWGAFAPPILIGAPTELFITPARAGTPAALCLNVQFERNGREANRWNLVFLMLNPPGAKSKAKPALYGIGTHFGDCRAFIRTKDGHFAYPKNGYILAPDGTQRGLRMHYHVLRGNRLVPTDETVSVKFIDPENPWRFSVMPQ